jgi:hypothetical protein
MSAKPMTYGKLRRAALRPATRADVKIAFCNCIKLAQSARFSAGCKRMFTLIVTGG